MTKPRIKRRTFLRGAGGAAIALPLFESLRAATGNHEVRADEGAIQRFITYATPLGTFAEMFFPTPPGGTPYAFPTAEDFVPRERVYRTGETAMVNPDFEPSRILAPLADHRADLTVIEGLSNSRGNHGGYCCMLTGRGMLEQNGGKFGSGISIDQEMALHVGDQTKFSSLQFGVRTPAQVFSRMTVSWYEAAQGAPAEKNPQVIWDRLFADLEADPAEAERIKARSLSVLDAALAQANDLHGSLGNQDQQKLDQYLTAFREVETKLQLAAAACDRPDRPEDASWDDEEMVPTTTALQLDLLAMAMACDLTRVATFQMDHEATNMTHPWLGVTGRWHDLSHNKGDLPGFEEEMDDYVAIQEWNASQIAYLVEQLQAFGVFSETAILWITPMHNGQIHNGTSLPIAMLGSMGGALRTGSHVRVAAEPERYVNDLHLTLLQAMGVQTDTFGEEDKVMGPIDEILA